MNTNVEDVAGRRSTWGQLAVRAVAGTSVGAAGAVALLAIATTTGGALEVQVGTRALQDVTLGAVIVMVVVSGVGAWGTAALATRFTSRPRLTFIAAATLVLAASLFPPVTAASGASVWWLEAMHLVVFAAVVAAMAPAIPARRTISTDRQARVQGSSA